MAKHLVEVEVPVGTAVGPHGRRPHLQVVRGVRPRVALHEPVADGDDLVLVRERLLLRTDGPAVLDRGVQLDDGDVVLVGVVVEVLPGLRVPVGTSVPGASLRCRTHR